MSSNDNEILSTPEIKLWIKQGSILDKDALIIKGRYVFDTMISPEDLLSLLNEERTQWDHTIMHQEIIRKLTDNMFLVHYVTEPALSSILPSDFIEKQIRFIKDSAYYGYSSNVPDKVFPKKEIYNRGKTIFAASILKQDEKKIVYYSFSQIKLKVNNQSNCRSIK